MFVEEDYQTNHPSSENPLPKTPSTTLYNVTEYFVTSMMLVCEG